MMMCPRMELEHCKLKRCELTARIAWAMPLCCRAAVSLWALLACATTWGSILLFCCVEESGSSARLSLMPNLKEFLAK